MKGSDINRRDIKAFILQNSNTMTPLEITTSLMAAFIVFVVIYLCIKTNLVKNHSLLNAKPGYSFSKVQFLWWTVIISISFIILYGKTENYNSFNQSALILLSIGIATAAGANLVDTSQKQNSTVRHQDADSKGFFADILSDESGVNVHRLQAVVFNVLFGVTFLVNLFAFDKFPEFNTSELGLMGVSSGGYLAMKTNENKTKTGSLTKSVN